jgi:SAM-dependent methyltransferase
MQQRLSHVPAFIVRGRSGVALYDAIGRCYAEMRRADPRIAARIKRALGDAAEVVNVGAGSGSYEPNDRTVLAVEPSDVMIRQRPPGAAPCIRAWAEHLPLATDSCDATMAVLTVHHWSDISRGLREMRRISRRRVVILTWVPDVAEDFWLTRDYVPEILYYDRQFFPTTEGLVALMEANVGSVHVDAVPLPHDCIDGFLGAYWQRPEAYLDPTVRSAISSFALLNTGDGLARLRRDIEDGSWTARNGHLLGLKERDLGYRLIRCELEGKIGS